MILEENIVNMAYHTEYSLEENIKRNRSASRRFTRQFELFKSKRYKDNALRAIAVELECMIENIMIKHCGKKPTAARMYSSIEDEYRRLQELEEKVNKYKKYLEGISRKGIYI